MHTALLGCLIDFRVVSHRPGAYTCAEHKCFTEMMPEENGTGSEGEGHTNYWHVNLNRNLNILPS